MLFVGMPALPLFAYYSYYRIIRSGYTPPVSITLAVGSVTLGFTVGMYIGDYLARDSRVVPMDFSAALRLLFSLLVPSVLLTGILAVLPQRKRRLGGNRQVRFPLRAAGYTCFVLAIGAAALSLFSIIFGDQLKMGKVLGRLPQLVVSMVGLGLAFLYLNRLLKNPTIEKVRRMDSRGPVLYLRPFNQERNWFVVAPAAQYLDRMANPLAHMNTTGITEVPLSLEQYLKPEIEKGIGPMVALGSPEDYLPPDGAARTYVEDFDWKSRFKQLAVEANAIIMEMSTSDNLGWELEWLRSNGLQSKLFILTRPRPPAIPTFLNRYAYAWLPILRGIPHVDWATFSAHLERLGYHFDFDKPGCGTVISFDANGTSVALTTEAETSDEFFRALEQRRIFGASVSQCARIRCECCSHIALKSQSDALDTKEMCADCTITAAIADQSPRERWRGAWRQPWYGLWFMGGAIGGVFGALAVIPTTLVNGSSGVAFSLVLTTGLVVAYIPHWVAWLLPAHRNKRREY